MFPSTLARKILMTQIIPELDRLRNLDSQVVADVYDRYFPEVYRYIRYRLGEETLAEDLASDVFVRLLEALQARRGPERDLRSWLIGTANHMVTDHLRRRYRRPVDVLPESLADDSPEPADGLEQREEKRVLETSLSRLTPEQQHVLALRFGQGYSLEETAAVMRKNINAVKAMQFRALSALQRQIGSKNE